MYPVQKNELILQLSLLLKLKDLNGIRQRRKSEKLISPPLRSIYHSQGIPFQNAGLKTLHHRDFITSALSLYEQGGKNTNQLLRSELALKQGK